MWFTPIGNAGFGNAIYVFIVLELFFLASTCSGGPYEDLLPEIARNHRDRMSGVGWKFYFGILGAILGLVVTGIVKEAFGFKVMGVIVAVFGLSFRHLGLMCVW